MLGLLVIFLFNLIFSVNSNLAERSANSSVVQFGWYYEIWLKLWNLVQLLNLAGIVKFVWNCEICLKLWNLAEIVKFGWNCEIRLKLWNLAEIVKFGRNSEMWLKLWNLTKIVNPEPSCIILDHLSFISLLLGSMYIWSLNQLNRS